MFSKITQNRVFCVGPTQNPPPFFQIGTFHGGLKDMGSELTQNYPPPQKKYWNFSWRTLCCGIVCEDYHCISRGYRLVQMFTVDKCWVWWELKFNRVRNSNVSLNHRMQSAKSVAITMLNFFPLATTIGYKNHTTNIAAGFQCSTLCITRKAFLEKIRSGPVRRKSTMTLNKIQVDSSKESLTKRAFSLFETNFWIHGMYFYANWKFFQPCLIYDLHLNLGFLS